MPKAGVTEAVAASNESATIENVSTENDIEVEKKILETVEVKNQPEETASPFNTEKITQEKIAEENNTETRIEKAIPEAASKPGAAPLPELEFSEEDLSPL